MTNFNPRAPCGARRRTYEPSQCVQYFNPRAPCGARRLECDSREAALRYFNPRAPCGARQTVDRELLIAYLFQSTRPMRGATTCVCAPPCQISISIHAPHAGRDARCKSNTHRINISIHAPHAGRDDHSEFFMPLEKNFNPRAPCGARRSRSLCKRLRYLISIHAPHAGRDKAL